MVSLGNPHNYINQDGMDFLSIGEPQIAPWSFTGLPNSSTPEIVLARKSIQYLILSGESALEQFREAPRTEVVILNLPLAIIRGKAPFLSEAHLNNFLDFWKGIFFPISEASIHYLAPASVERPSRVPLVYVNRNAVQSYVQG
jgi:hypothetical protein